MDTCYLLGTLLPFLQKQQQQKNGIYSVMSVLFIFPTLEMRILCIVEKPC